MAHPESGARLFVLTGPTASGKSELALAFAEQEGCEILSVDSMAVYRRMDIGTAKSSPEERARVPHHGIDLVGADECFDSERFRKYADSVIADARTRGKRILVVGGTPLYLMALLKGYFEGPSADPALRAELLAEETNEPGSLHEKLRELDPEGAEQIHRNNVKRLVRALEVQLLTGRPIREWQTQFRAKGARYEFAGAQLSIDREQLKARVAERIRKMFRAGFVDEVRDIREHEGFSETSRQAIGYKEVLQFLDGKLGADELPYRVRSNTNRFVRRQHTWFRRMTELRSLDASDRTLEQRLELLRALFSEVSEP